MVFVFLDVDECVIGIYNCLIDVICVNNVGLFICCSKINGNSIILIISKIKYELISCLWL